MVHVCSCNTFGHANIAVAAIGVINASIRPQTSPGTKACRSAARGCCSVLSKAEAFLSLLSPHLFSQAEEFLNCYQDSCNDVDDRGGHTQPCEGHHSGKNVYVRKALGR